MATAAERDGYRAASENLGFRRGPVDPDREEGHRDEEEAEKDEEDRPLDGARAARGGGGLGRLFHDIEYGRNAGRKQDAGEFVIIRGEICKNPNKIDVFVLNCRKIGGSGPAPACAAHAAEVERKGRNGKAGCGIARRRWRLCHDPAFRFYVLEPPLAAMPRSGLPVLWPCTTETGRGDRVVAARAACVDTSPTPIAAFAFENDRREAEEARETARTRRASCGLTRPL